MNIGGLALCFRPHPRPIFLNNNGRRKYTMVRMRPELEGLSTDIHVSRSYLTDKNNFYIWNAYSLLNHKTPFLFGPGAFVSNCFAPLLVGS